MEGNLVSNYKDIKEVVELMQGTINLWENSLKVTKGAIRPDKSFIYPFSFKFKSNGEYQYEKVQDLDLKLLVRNKYRESEIL